MLDFDLLEIFSSFVFLSFIDMPISEKSSKIKFLEKFQKNLYKFLCQKWDRETPGRHQEGLPCHLPHRGRGPAWPRPPGVRRPHLASHLSLPPLLFLSPEKQPYTSSNLSSCCSSLRFFDLLAQPNISAEIWSNCSPVCDSSACPSRISFGELFLEYFSIVGGRINEYACLFYCLEMIF
jgi:hypothetical protein